MNVFQIFLKFKDKNNPSNRSLLMNVVVGMHTNIVDQMKKRRMGKVSAKDCVHISTFLTVLFNFPILLCLFIRLWHCVA